MFDKFIMWFAHWFSSPKAVIQVTIITLIWVIIEAIWPHLDPNGFFLMYVFTLWSGWTQNILAYASNLSTRESQATQELIQKQNDKIEHLILLNVHQNEAMIDMMCEIRELQRANANEIREIADDVDDIKEELDD